MPTKLPPRGRSTPSAPKTVKQGLFARLLEPMDRLVEAIYSVLIVLTFTLATRVVRTHSGATELAEWDTVAQLFWAAMGCAVAWGLIDGAMHVLARLFERGQNRRLFRLVRNAQSTEEGVALLAYELADDVGEIPTAEERHRALAGLYERLRAAPPPNVGLVKADFAGGLGTLLVAVCAAVPVLLPLIILPGGVNFRLRMSNLVAFVLLFGLGFRWGQYAGVTPWLSGLLLLVLGVTMVAVAILLGG